MARLALIFAVSLTMTPGCSPPRLDAPHVPLSAAPIPDAIEDTYDIPLDALEGVMRFAMWEMEWGPMKIKHESEGLTASAVRPNGRTVRITAQKNERGLVHVQVHAGLFGNDAIEKAFHRELAAAVGRWRDREGRND